MNVSVLEHCALNQQIFWCGKIYYANTISLLSWCRLLFPVIGLKNPLSPMLH